MSEFGASHGVSGTHMQGTLIAGQASHDQRLGFVKGLFPRLQDVTRSLHVVLHSSGEILDSSIPTTP